MTPPNSRAESAIYDYRNTLLKIEEITDQLLSAIKDWDSKEVDQLIIARKALCNELGSCMTQLFEVLGKNELSDSQHAELIRELEDRHAILAGKQATCESILTHSMAECRNDILNLNRQKRVATAYCPLPTQSARFLDNRL